ncbi:FtsK/SpoIIIE domain-containing protein [Paenibacillus sp. FSL H7-0331]|uniref:FtsK/SpoIIIE domain-containing protein n=1 Tax=Paenibacillus sp. FSL H7-0331 TaxID=1920421 RepID=UPI00096FF13F|nr:FtsK/SpoIIIE domain-containing protein [Paenibacillus sp. FSL H7-0331]OMF02872.1 hypothetical protein BK127_36535 [Paenibacillus sp. FSL H7-0331]
MAKRKQQQLVRITWPSIDKKLPERKTIRLDTPPSPFSKDQSQVVTTLLSMLMTTIGPIILVMTMMTRADNGTVGSRMVMIFGSIVTTFLMLIVAMVSLHSQRKQTKKQKQQVEKQYVSYRSRLSNWYKELYQARETQMQALQTWHPSLPELFHELEELMHKKTDESLSTRLWWIGKESDHYMNTSLGKGPVPLWVQAELDNRDAHEADAELLQQAVGLNEMFTTGQGFPYVVNLAEYTFIAGCGSSPEFRLAWIRAFVTRLCLTHRYDNLRLFILTSGAFERTETPDEEVDEGDSQAWYYHLPHVMGSAGIYSKQQIDSFIEENEELFRSSVEERGYYALIVIDDWSSFEEEPLAKRLLHMSREQGVITMIEVNTIMDIPKGEEVLALELHANTSGANVYRNGEKIVELSGMQDELELTRFIQNPEQGLQQYAVFMSNIYYPNAPQSNLKQAIIPDSILFDDLFTDSEDGLDEGMNKNPFLRAKEIKRIWDNQDISSALANPIKSIVGRGWEGKNLHIDLYKRNHGFIGGTTGSGKSVFLQAYLLSLAVSYSPENVAFVLIDGKGGGMAEPLKHLPHVLGTADSGELFIVQRALTAIEAEFRKRDEAFKEVGQFEWKDYMRDYYKEKKAYLKDSSIKVRPNLPLLLVVFDELGQLIKFSSKKYSDIVDNLLLTLERLAGQGRSYGIRLLFSGHSPSEAQRVAHNLDYMIALKVEDRDSSKAMIGDERAIRIRSKGRGYVRLGEEVLEFQGAYAKPERVKAITKELQYLSRDFTLSPIVLEPLPQVLNLEELITYEGSQQEQDDIGFRLPMGLIDLPEQQKQLKWVYDLAGEGNLAFTGPMKSGKTMGLHTVIMQTIQQFTPQDANVWLVDWDSYSLKKWKSLPHIVEYVDDRDNGIKRLKDVIQFLAAKMEERKDFSAGFDGAGWHEFRAKSEMSHTHDNYDLSYHVLVIDGYVRVTDYLEQKSMDDNQLLMSLLSDASRYGIYIIASINNTSIASRSRGRRGFNHIIPLASTELCFDFYGREGLRMTEEVPGRTVVRLDWKSGKTIKKICCEVQLVMPFLSILEDQRPEDAMVNSIEDLNQQLQLTERNLIVSSEWTSRLQEDKSKQEVHVSHQADLHVASQSLTLTMNSAETIAIRNYLQKRNIDLKNIPETELEIEQLSNWTHKREHIRYPILLYRSPQDTDRESHAAALGLILNQLAEKDPFIDGIIPLIDSKEQADVIELLAICLEPRAQEMLVPNSLDQQIELLMASQQTKDKQYLFISFGTSLWNQYPEEILRLEEFHKERKSENNEMANLHEWLGMANIVPNLNHKVFWKQYEGDLLLLTLNVIIEYMYFLEDIYHEEDAIQIAVEYISLQENRGEDENFSVSLLIRQEQQDDGTFILSKRIWTQIDKGD